MGASTENICDGCGICCLPFSLPPFDANEMPRAPAAVLRRLDEYAAGPRYRESNPCPWQDLVTGECRHHDIRPVLCRWFEAGGTACLNLRAKAGLTTPTGDPAAGS